MKLCKVDGCELKHYGLGFCRNHYGRYKWNGYPEYKESKTHAFLNKILESYQGKQNCIDWPFSDNGHGYGKLNVGNKFVYAHRYILSLTTEEPYDNPLDAAHSCGNSLCVNPNHLSWKTKYENWEDTVRHGTIVAGEFSHFAKLTEKEVMEIRASKDEKTLKTLSEKYGVTRNHIRRIIKEEKRKYDGKI